MKLLNSQLLLGGRACIIALILFLPGEIPSLEISIPKSFNLSVMKIHLSLFSFNPSDFILLNNLSNILSNLASFCACKIILSLINLTPLILPIFCSYTREIFQKHY